MTVPGQARSSCRVAGPERFSRCRRFVFVQRLPRRRHAVGRRSADAWRRVGGSARSSSTGRLGSHRHGDLRRRRPLAARSGAHRRRRPRAPSLDDVTLVRQRQPAGPICQLPVGRRPEPHRTGRVLTNCDAFENLPAAVLPARCFLAAERTWLTRILMAPTRLRRAASLAARLTGRCCAKPRRPLLRHCSVGGAGHGRRRHPPRHRPLRPPAPSSCAARPAYAAVRGSSTDRCACVCGSADRNFSASRPAQRLTTLFPHAEPSRCRTCRRSCRSDADRLGGRRSRRGGRVRRRADVVPGVSSGQTRGRGAARGPPRLHQRRRRRGRLDASTSTSSASPNEPDRPATRLRRGVAERRPATGAPASRRSRRRQSLGPRFAVEVDDRSMPSSPS